MQRKCLRNAVDCGYVTRMLRIKGTDTVITVLGKVYMTDKEAAKRYAHSQSWFQRRRHDKKPPPYVKFEHKVFYPLEETDRYFAALLRTMY